MQNILKTVSERKQLIKLDLSNNTSQALNRFGEETSILEDFTTNN